MALTLKSMFSLARPQTGQVRGARTGVPGAWAPSVNEDTAMTVAAFYRGVTFIATQIGKLPWNVKDAKYNVLAGKVPNLLDLAPNPEMNAMTWRIWMTYKAIVKGNSYSEIQRDNAGRVIALWPIDPDRVDMLRTDAGDLVYRVSNPGSEQVFIMPWDMFHLKNFHTQDGIVGQGLVAYASQTLGIATAADRMASGIFNNGGLPSGVLTMTGKLGDEAYKRLKENWAATHGGKRAGGTAILEQGVEFKSIQTDPEVLQFLETRKFSVVEVARFLGLPPHKLMDTASTTFANVENANLEVITDTLSTWASNFEMEADVKILNNRFGGYFSEIDLRELSRGDSTSRSNYYQKMMQSGAMTPNQIRAAEGMTPYSNGDTYYIAVNNFTPADKVDALVDAQIASKSNPGTIDSPASKSGGKDPNAEDPSTKALKLAATQYLTK